MGGVQYSTFTKASFEAAHSLPLCEGECNKIHGHSYQVEAGIVYDSLDADSGMNLDMKIQKDWLRAICKEFDHTNLNDHSRFSGYPTTAEKIARVIGTEMMIRAEDWFNPAHHIGTIVPKKMIVRVHETNDCAAEVVIDF